jgi:hypothetical protein
MLISHNKKFIYTKTLKTASSSTESYFEKYCFDESNWQIKEYRNEAISKHGIIGLRSGLHYEIQSALWYSHMPAETIKSLIGNDIWNSYFKFCTIRNPFTKIVSLYNFRKLRFLRKKNLNMKKLYASFFNLLSGNYLKRDFEYFIFNLPNPLDRNKYVINNDFCLDSYIKYEDLENGIKNICKKLDLPFEKSSIPYFKKGKQVNVLSKYYSDESKKHISKIYEWELSFFNYKFPK